VTTDGLINRKFDDLPVVLDHGDAAWGAAKKYRRPVRQDDIE
jgi:hypothetical protein